MISSSPVIINWRSSVVPTDQQSFKLWKDDLLSLIRSQRSHFWKCYHVSLLQGSVDDMTGLFQGLGHIYKSVCDPEVRALPQRRKLYL